MFAGKLALILERMVKQYQQIFRKIDMAIRELGFGVVTGTTFKGETSRPTKKVFAQVDVKLKILGHQTNDGIATLPSMKCLEENYLNCRI